MTAYKATDGIIYQPTWLPTQPPVALISPLISIIPVTRSERDWDINQRPARLRECIEQQNISQLSLHN